MYLSTEDFLLHAHRAQATSSHLMDTTSLPQLPHNGGLEQTNNALVYFAGDSILQRLEKVVVISRLG
jgi:hypothetical protein